MKLFFDPVDTQTVGFNLTFPNNDVIRLYLRITVVVQDLAAHKAMYHCVGSSGHKFCMKCLNIRADKALTHEEDEVKLLVSQVIEKKKLVLARDADVHEAIDHLEELKLSCCDADAKKTKDINKRKARFKQAQTSHGFTFHDHNVLSDRSLRNYFKPASSFMHDWMHLLVVQGCLQTAMYCAMEELQKVGQGYNATREYLQQFTWPKSLHSKSPNAHEAFGDYRVKNGRKAKTVKLTASEAVSVMTHVKGLRPTRRTSHGYLLETMHDNEPYISH